VSLVSPAERPSNTPVHITQSHPNIRHRNPLPQTSRQSTLLYRACTTAQLSISAPKKPTQAHPLPACLMPPAPSGLQAKHQTPSEPSSLAARRESIATTPSHPARMYSTCIHMYVSLLLLATGLRSRTSKQVCTAPPSHRPSPRSPCARARARSHAPPSHGRRHAAQSPSCTETLARRVRQSTTNATGLSYCNRRSTPHCCSLRAGQRRGLLNGKISSSQYCSR
jgi:hypothetical protein